MLIIAMRRGIRGKVKKHSAFSFCVGSKADVTVHAERHPSCSLLKSAEAFFCCSFHEVCELSLVSA